MLKPPSIAACMALAAESLAGVRRTAHARSFGWVGEWGEKEKVNTLLDYTPANTPASNTLIYRRILPLTYTRDPMSGLCPKSGWLVLHSPHRTRFDDFFLEPGQQRPQLSCCSRWADILPIWPPAGALCLQKKPRPADQTDNGGGGTACLGTLAKRSRTESQFSRVRPQRLLSAPRIETFRDCMAPTAAALVPWTHRLARLRRVASICCDTRSLNRVTSLMRPGKESRISSKEIHFLNLEIRLLQYVPDIQTVGHLSVFLASIRFASCCGTSPGDRTRLGLGRVGVFCVAGSPWKYVRPAGLSK